LHGQILFYLDNPDPVERKTTSNPYPKKSKILPDWTLKCRSCTPTTALDAQVYRKDGLDQLNCVLPLAGNEFRVQTARVISVMFVNFKGQLPTWLCWVQHFRSTVSFSAL